MCGPALLQQNPNFERGFWKLDSDIFYFFKAYPWWLVPRASNNRAKLLNGVKRWHDYARSNFTESCIEWDGHDPYYGSPLMRSRQEYLAKIDFLDEDALASQDLGLLWAENANSIPAIFWMVYETLKQPTQLSQALLEIKDSQPGCFHHANPSLDVESVCNVPILQSMYAETLRLYTSLFSLRSAIHRDFTLDGFTIPKNELIAVDSRVTAMDKSIWNTRADEGEEEGPLPLDQFWAERFLVYPKDPASGPLRGGLSNHQASPTSSAHTESNTPRFTTEGLAGAWTPYGGGSRQCPGRNFAKQEIIVAFALLLSEFEIELVDADKRETVEPDMKYYGLGTLPPKTKTPFRIRRRVRGPAEPAQVEAM
ncbi:MAG: hypothetical protein LQ350_008000 [Teloschistes chrysophthalmus]|nr:MAG: hypothetical protein LQ350_008000 [Niorma chrysophthalma]